MKKKILIIFGTRPEAIKMAPLIRECKKHNSFITKVCVTAQHRELLDQVLKFFKIKPDFDLKLMKPGQSLFDITSDAVKSMEKVLDSFKPNLILVQGDTTTAFVGALCGFYEKAKIGHIEAGLRSFNKYSPFPEEMNRIIVGRLADFHFAPTQKAKNNLKNEGIIDNVRVVGNTVIDALLWGLKLITKNDQRKLEQRYKFIDFSAKLILVTGHRRESFGLPFENICNALKQIASNNDVEIVYPVHLNPNVRKPVFGILRGVKNIHLIEPIPYKDLIWLMKKSYLVMTDSGGIQEEAPTLGKPVLVMRNVTERIEGIKAGTAKLVGTNARKIVSETNKLLNNKMYYKKMAKSVNPYGDGKTSKRIIKVLMSKMV